MYSSSLSLTSVVNGVGGQGHAWGQFNPWGGTKYLKDMKSVGPHSWSGRVRKISPPLGSREKISPKFSITSMTKKNRENALNLISLSKLNVPFFLD